MSPVCRFDPAAGSLPHLRPLTPSAAAAVTASQRAAALSARPAQSHGSGVTANAPTVVSGPAVERPGTTRTTQEQRSVTNMRPHYRIYNKHLSIKPPLIRLFTLSGLQEPDQQQQQQPPRESGLPDPPRTQTGDLPHLPRTQTRHPVPHHRQHQRQLEDRELPRFPGATQRPTWPVLAGRQ